MSETTNADKRANIYEAYYCVASDAEMTNRPGDDVAQVTAYWLPLKANNIVFTEIDLGNGDPVEQNFSAKMAGLSESNLLVTKKLATNTIILKLIYNNGVTKVAGTTDEPISMQVASGEAPYAHILSFKRYSAEKAKQLQSF